MGAIRGRPVPGVRSNTSVYLCLVPAAGGVQGCAVYPDSTSVKPTHMRATSRNLLRVKAQLLTLGINKTVSVDTRGRAVDEASAIQDQPSSV
ncbi:uncharacterized [Tachysurus ichikawai]